MTRTRWPALLTLAATALLMAARPAAAQAERYELGRRLRAFEDAWERAPRERQVKSLAGLPKVTTQFFGFQFGEAGRTLDDSRRVLAGVEATPQSAWAESLGLVPEKRLIDAASPGLGVVVKPFYAVKGPVPEGAYCRVRLGVGDPAVVEPVKLPANVTVTPHKVTDAGQDVLLTLNVMVGSHPAAEQQATVSVVPDLAKRLAALAEVAKAEPATIEAATLRDRAELLTQLADGTAADRKSVV